MYTRVFPDGSVSLSEYAIGSVAKASRRLAQGDRRLSTHDFNAAAIVNGRLDLLDREYRVELIAMGRDWAHAVIEQIFEHCEKEMRLPARHKEAPVGDQCMFSEATDLAAINPESN